MVKRALDPRQVALKKGLTTVAIQDRDHGLFRQFTDEFNTIFQLLQSKQSKEVTIETVVKQDGGPLRQEIAFCGEIGYKLVVLVDKVMQTTSDELESTKKSELLLGFGDKCYHAQEFHAASTCFYENVLVLDERMEQKEGIRQPQSVLQRILSNSKHSTSKRSRVEGQTYVRSLFGVAMCAFHVGKRSDRLVQAPRTLEKLIQALRLLRLGMKLAVNMEHDFPGHFAWLILNGSVFIYSIAKPLQALGFSNQVVAYLKWSLLALESTVTLSTTKYITWRVELGSAICDCYDTMAMKMKTRVDQYNQSAIACAVYIQQIVQRLRKEEELEMPLPIEIQQTLTQAETTCGFLMFRVKALAAPELSSSTSTIETIFPSIGDQIRALIDIMEILSRRGRGEQGGVVLIPSGSSSPLTDSLLSLFDFVMNLVTPMLKSLVEVETLAELSIQDQATFPLSYHLIIIYHGSQLALVDDRMTLLLKSARERVKSVSEGVKMTDKLTINCLLELHEALFEVQLSWIAWSALAPEERLNSESKLQLHLVRIDKVIPGELILRQLSTALQHCVDTGTLSRTHPNLMTSVALQLWREVALPIVKELDAMELSQLSKPLVQLACELLLVIHSSFVAVEFNDMLLHAQICLRLATFLSVRGKARVGSQVVRQCLDRVNSHRSELVTVSSHRQAAVANDTDVASSLSNASFSCAITSNNTRILETLPTQAQTNTPDLKSPFGAFSQELSCMHVDLLLLLYRLELQDASKIDTLPSSSANTRHSTLLSTEAKLLKECNQNGYASALLHIQRLACPQKSVKERRILVDESFHLLEKMEKDEQELALQLLPNDLSSTASVIPAAPIVIIRSSSAITVKIVEAQRSFRKRVKYYMVFGKSAGVGTAVTLSNNHLVGTGVPMFPPHLLATISGLLPNESYVFAVAAYDDKHQVIQSIGETSNPVVALNPLPVLMCYGYLAKVCNEVQLVTSAKKAAKYLYNAVVTRLEDERPMSMSNPFYKQALKHHKVAQLPLPILNLCIQALLILCHDEAGDLEQDITLDTQSPLTTMQTKVLQDSRRISMAIEMACATNNHEAIRMLCFKGYRMLLPLLHLKESCHGLTFAALMTYVQALDVIPRENWAVDTQKIRARVSFELFRISQTIKGDVSRSILPFILSTSHEPEQTDCCPEVDSLREVLALYTFVTEVQASPPSLVSTIPAATAVSPRVTKVKEGLKEKAQSNPSVDQAEAGNARQSLSELLQTAGNDMAKVFGKLDQMSSSDVRTIELTSKICGAVLAAGINECPLMDTFLSSLKVSGEISYQVRATLGSIDGGSLLPEMKDTDTIQASETSLLASQNNDDVYLYRWCGELLFIQSVLLYRKLSKLCEKIKSVDAANGPDTEDCMYEFHDENKSNNNDVGHEKLNMDVGMEGDKSAEESALDHLFTELLEKSAACCKLFRLASCWQGLQAIVQQVWNGIWRAWVAPSRMSMFPARLTHLSLCINALLDMMEVAITMSSSERTALHLNLDQQWVARLMTYSLRAYCAAKDWKSVVEKGTRYYSLCEASNDESRSCEQSFALLIHAQRQILSHYDVLVKAAEDELRACVLTVQEQDQETKSRLVADENQSLDDATATFHATKNEREQCVQALTNARDAEETKLTELLEIDKKRGKTRNKSHQTLAMCHDLIKHYRRLDPNTLDAGDTKREKLRRQIVALYTRCVKGSRQKGEKRIGCQALHELGDFHLACGDQQAATKRWLEVLDAAFHTLNVGTLWRQVLAPSADEYLQRRTGKEQKNDRDELWTCMECCSVLSKLIMYSTGNNVYKAIDYALMAVAIFTRFYACSVSHPTKCFLYGSYRVVGHFWPGRTLFMDPDGIFPLSFGLLFVLVPDLLLPYDHHYASTIMPLIAGYEYVAATCLEDANHVANARRFRLEALIQCGRFEEAFQVLGTLLQGRNSCRAPGQDPVEFHNDKSMLDDDNQAALNWLGALNVEQTQADLSEHYEDALVMHLLAAMFHLHVAIARYAPSARSSAKKMAQALLALIKTHTEGARLLHTQTAAHDVAASQTLPLISREELQFHQLRADILLQLSYITSYEKDWTLAQANSKDAIEAYRAIAQRAEALFLQQLDQKLPFSLGCSRSTFLAKCHLQTVTCCLAQGHYDAALKTAQIAIEETRVAGEEHFRQRLELQRLQAAVFLGEREMAERALSILRDDARATSTSSSLSPVQTLQVLSSLLRSKALVSSNPAALKAVYEHLSEAEDVLDALLEHDGWVGLDTGHSSAFQQVQKRFNLYQPGIPDFVNVQADLAHVLLEYPLMNDENPLMRHEKALSSIEKGLRALDHTTQQIFGVKARVLLMKGVLLSKALSSRAPQLVTEEQMSQQFKECVEALTSSIQSSIEGEYERQIVRLALIELVNLFGQQLMPGNEDAHAQAACHYLNLALEVQKHELVLFDTLELQNGTITAVEKLPASVCAAINGQSQENVPEPSPSIKASLDVVTIVNFFLRLLRSQHILPISTTALQDTCFLLHSFLIQHHSTYSRLACLTQLPPVPTSSPEIQAGLISALWGQDLAPSIADEITHPTTLTLYFTLGPTKVFNAEALTRASDAAALARMEKFTSTPLLSKRCHIERQSVQYLKTNLSNLRIQMEDEETLGIDRSIFLSILCNIQQILRKSNADVHSTDCLRDAFGNMITIECTLELVRCLENLFSINKGVNVTNIELCYFLRDLLD